MDEFGNSYEEASKELVSVSPDGRFEYTTEVLGCKMGDVEKMALNLYKESWGCPDSFRITDVINLNE